MKKIILTIALIVFGLEAEDINFDELRKPGKTTEITVSVPGVASKGQSYISRFSEIDDRRVEESKRYRSSYNSPSSESASSSSAIANSSSKSSSDSQNRGVISFENNGKVNGVQSWVAVCKSGGRHVLYFKNGTWYHGSHGDMGSKYNSWSKEEVGNYACKEL